MNNNYQYGGTTGKPSINSTSNVRGGLGTVPEQSHVDKKLSHDFDSLEVLGHSIK